MNSAFSKFKKDYLSARRGFSLAEVVIVIAIMVIMTGVLFARQNSNKLQTEAELAARQVAAQLRSLQNDALNGKIVGDVPACGMEFSTTPDDPDKSYKVSYYDCSGMSISGSEQDFLIGKKTVNKTVMLGAGKIFRFSSPQARLNIAGSDFIRVSSVGNGDELARVCVYENGNIIDTKEENCP